ncbi:hypothetical protein FPV67DRAFT_20060 [Lyophyllum atratum]|nr:hypothetical protein FPV67DRAFT_20060 [Lyophyllum atratum]
MEALHRRRSATGSNQSIPCSRCRGYQNPLRTQTMGLPTRSLVSRRQSTQFHRKGINTTSILQLTTGEINVPLIPRSSPSSFSATRIEASLDTNKDEAVHLLDLAQRDGVLGQSETLIRERERALGHVLCRSTYTTSKASQVRWSRGSVPYAPSRVCKGNLLVVALLGCGPASFDAIVREAVAAEMIPARVFRGEHTEYIQFRKSSNIN